MRPISMPWSASTWRVNAPISGSAPPFAAASRRTIVSAPRWWRIMYCRKRPSNSRPSAAASRASLSALTIPGMSPPPAPWSCRWSSASGGCSPRSVSHRSITSISLSCEISMRRASSGMSALALRSRTRLVITSACAWWWIMPRMKSDVRAACGSSTRASRPPPSRALRDGSPGAPGCTKLVSTSPLVRSRSEPPAAAAEQDRSHQGERRPARPQLGGFVASHRPRCRIAYLAGLVHFGRRSGDGQVSGAAGARTAYGAASRCRSRVGC